MHSTASSEAPGQSSAVEESQLAETDQLTSDASTAPPPSAPDHDLAELRQTPFEQRWNFWGLTLYQVTLRVGWIFKTESIIMPAVLDSLGCGPAVRGWLPLFNRLGQSVPPLLAAHWVRGARQKKRLLAFCSAAMAVSFLVLALSWWLTGGGGVWLPYLFLAIYAVFFVSTGIHQLCFGALQGKLIPFGVAADC